jgi:hypothetical protein
VITIDAPEGQDELAAEPAVPQEIRDEDMLNALEKVAVEFREIAPPCERTALSSFAWASMTRSNKVCA